MIRLSTPSVHIDAGTPPDEVSAAHRTDGTDYTFVQFGPVDLYFHRLTSAETADWLRSLADRIEATA